MLRTFGVLGAGAMGRAIVEGVLRTTSLKAEDILVVDHDPERRQAMAALGCVVAESSSAMLDATCLLLAVRPQDFAAAAAQLRSDKCRLAVSVMAGLSADAIAAALGPSTRVVRTMPNTAASIGEAVIGMAAGPGATEDDLAIAERLLQGVGTIVQVDEAQMHAVTAVSGSGPAYVYLLAEAIEAEARALGLSAEQADVLVRSMVKGAALLQGGDDRSPGELRQAVTTPGGTTEAGLEAMQAGGFVEAVRAGVRAACRRGEALATSSPSQ
jgi:pyrroline-5-carboxylate reductase